MSTVRDTDASDAGIVLGRKLSFLFHFEQERFALGEYKIQVTVVLFKCCPGSSHRFGRNLMVSTAFRTMTAEPVYHNPRGLPDTLLIDFAASQATPRR